MTGHLPPSGADRNEALKFFLVVWGVVLLLVLVFGGAFWQFLTNRNVTTQLQSTRGELGDLASQLEEGDPEARAELQGVRGELEKLKSEVSAYERRLGRLQDAESTAVTKRAAERARIASIQAALTRTEKALRALREEESVFRMQTADVLGDDSGRRIAASESLTRLAVEVVGGDTVAEDDVKDLEDEYGELAAAMNEVPDDEDAAVAIDPGYVSAVESLAQRVAAALRQKEERNTALQALLRASADTVPGSQTLAERLAEARQATALDPAEAAAAAREATRRDEVEKTRVAAAAAELAAQQRVREEQLRLIQAESEAEALGLHERTAAVLAEVARREAVARFERDLPEIQRLLTPLTTPGNKQLVQGKWLYREEPAPLSLAQITARRALEDSPTGHMEFYWIVGSRENDRPNGVFREYIGGAIRDPAVRDVVRAQRLVRDHRELLVERKLLAE